MLSGNHRVDLISSHEPSQRQRSPTVEQPSAGRYESAVDHPRETPSNAEATHPGCVVVMFEAMRAREHQAQWPRVKSAGTASTCGNALTPRTGREVECVSRAGLA